MKIVDNRSTLLTVARKVDIGGYICWNDDVYLRVGGLKAESILVAEGLVFVHLKSGNFTIKHPDQLVTPVTVTEIHIE